MKYLTILTLLTAQIAQIYSDKVLILQPFSPRSHKIVVEPIAKALGSRGHQVTFMSPFKFEKLPPPNVTEIVFDEIIDSFWELEDIFLDSIRYGWYPSVLKKYYVYHSKVCRQLYNTGLLQKWTVSTEKFKVVMMDAVFTECILPLWKNFAENVILINPSVLTPMVVDVMNLPVPYSYVPYTAMGYTDRMNFFQRFVNSIYWIMNGLVDKFARSAFYENVILPSFPDTKPNDQTLTNISLMFVNEDPVFCSPRLLLPTVVLVGGIQCKKAEPLPEDDLKTFVDGSGDDGFILVSFGSIIKGNVMGDQLKNTLIEGFSRIKQRVVWKYEDEISGLPDNVKTVKWFPQNDILGHPKIRAFVNQGGLNSVQESIYHAVAQVCFPMTTDQPYLVVKATELGIAISLDYISVTVDELVNAINMAVNDQTMRNQVQYYSQIFRERKEGPLETALYWIEYVMKFNGAQHFQSAGGDLNIFQYYLLDVYAIYLLLIVLALIFIWTFVKNFLKLVLPQTVAELMNNIKQKYH